LEKEVKTILGVELKASHLLGSCSAAKQKGWG
jgi:hypothetical protein